VIGAALRSEYEFAWNGRVPTPAVTGYPAKGSGCRHDGRPARSSGRPGQQPVGLLGSRQWKGWGWFRWTSRRGPAPGGVWPGLPSVAAAGAVLRVAVWCCGRDRRSRSAWLRYLVAGAAHQSRFRSGRRLVAVSGDAPEPWLPKAPSCSPGVAGVSGRAGAGGRRVHRHFTAPSRPA